MLWLGFSLGLILLVSCFLSNYLRSKEQPIPDLIPNCLLTKYPLVFIPGPRSLFYFMRYWNEIPHFLASHGYEVFLASLPWKDSEKRKKYLLDFLTAKSQDSKEKIHLFFDQSSVLEISDLLRQHSFTCLASVTWVKTNQDSDAFLTQVRGLSSPMEELVLNEKELKAEKKSSVHEIFWKTHLFFTGQSLKQQMQTRGFRLSMSMKHLLVGRAQFLAERDLLQAQSSPTL